MKIPILTYHSMAIDNNEYSGNDHVALAQDLELIHQLGFKVMPLFEVVDRWLHDSRSLDSQKIVALTCDDGPDFDFHDLPHPGAGMQRSMLNILKDHKSRHGNIDAHLTSFVIVSPEARTILDRTCMIGLKWWNDDWWSDAVASGLMGIGNHSWDHNHDSLTYASFEEVERGTFKSVDNYGIADYQIRQAAEYLKVKVPNPSAALFAYPYGKSNEFLAAEYLPLHGTSVGLKAAFADDAVPMTSSSNQWRLPRFVFRRDWKTPEDLQKLLQDCI